MSQYINFFIKHDNGELIPIGDYSRSNPIYKALEYLVPYGEATLFTKDIYNNAYEDMSRAIEDYKRFIENYKKQNVLIATMNDPLNKKLEAIAENDSAIKELEEEIEIYTVQRYYLNLYYGMNSKYDKNEIWVGIEVPISDLDEE